MKTDDLKWSYLLVRDITDKIVHFADYSKYRLKNYFVKVDERSDLTPFILCTYGEAVISEFVLV